MRVVQVSAMYILLQRQQMSISHAHFDWLTSLQLVVGVPFITQVVAVVIYMGLAVDLRPLQVRELGIAQRLPNKCFSLGLSQFLLLCCVNITTAGCFGAA